MDEFSSLGYPILVGASRKSFIGKILEPSVGESSEEGEKVKVGIESEVQYRLEGSLVAMTASILSGASIVRVHDVKESVRAAKIADAIRCDGIPPWNER